MIPDYIVVDCPQCHEFNPYLKSELPAISITINIDWSAEVEQCYALVPYDNKKKQK